MIGMVCAILPVPIYVMLLLWIDRYEAEPLWMLATSFFWGALIAVFIAIDFQYRYCTYCHGRSEQRRGR